MITTQGKIYALLLELPRLVTFGSTSSKYYKDLKVSVIRKYHRRTLQQRDGTLIEITVNIVPSITGTIQRQPVKFESKERFEKKTNEVFHLADNILLKRELVKYIKYFTDRSKAVLLLWIFYVFVLSYVCYVFVRVC